MTVTVRGASDDLIEIEGDLNEEFSGGDEPRFLAFSDGTVLTVTYGGEGFWRINQRRKGTAKYDKKEATDIVDDYSDTVTLTGVSWVVCGDRFEKIGK